MKYRQLTKARKGTLARIDVGRNPQKYSHEVWGRVQEIIGMSTFTDPAYGTDSLLKVTYLDDNSKLKTGHLLGVLQY